MDFKNLEELIKYIEKETGAIAGNSPKQYTTENWDGIMEFEEFKIFFFGPYDGVVCVPEDYELIFRLNEPV